MKGDVEFYMPKLIGIQSGHYQIQSNPDPVLASETGAPGEMEFNWAVTNVLSTILQKYNFQVQIDSANTNNDPNTTDKDFDLYLAIHAEGAPAGGYIGIPDASVDSAHVESQRIQEALNANYFNDTGIARNDQILTNNISFYYMWHALSAKTPCILIECGDLADPHDSVILADHTRVAAGIAHGICAAFDVAWNGPDNTTPVPPPVPPVPPAPTCEEQLANLQKEFDDYKASHPTIATNSTPTPVVPTLSTPTEAPQNQPNSSTVSVFLKELGDLFTKHFGK